MIQKIRFAPWVKEPWYGKCDALWKEGKDVQFLEGRGGYFSIRDIDFIKDIGITELHFYNRGQKVWELII